MPIGKATEMQNYNFLSNLTVSYRRKLKGEVPVGNVIRNSVFSSRYHGLEFYHGNAVASINEHTDIVCHFLWCMAVA